MHKTCNGILESKFHADFMVIVAGLHSGGYLSRVADSRRAYSSSAGTFLCSSKERGFKACAKAAADTENRHVNGAHCSTNKFTSRGFASYRSIQQKGFTCSASRHLETHVEASTVKLEGATQTEMCWESWQELVTLVDVQGKVCHASCFGI